MQNRVQEVREARGLRREDVASMAGITVQTVYTMETGRNQPRLDIAQKVARALDSTLDELFPMEATR
jgi:putative transcriptional regulator